MSALESFVDVLVVGAGPTGLAAAISLIQNGCGKVMVVDALSAGQNTSRAAVIHANTLEVLEITGTVPTFLNRGKAVPSIAMRQGDSILFRVNFDHIDSKYKYFLVIPQSETEKILAERLGELGVSVIWNKKVVGVSKIQEHLKEVTFESGETVKARYIVAADGLRSKVREAAGIQYTDPTPGRSPDGYLSQMNLMDIRTSPPAHDVQQELTLYQTSQGVIVWGSLPDGSVRVVVPLPLSADPPKNPDLEYVRKLLKERGLNQPVESVIWGSRFRVRSRLAHDFFLPSKDGKGAVVLAGDAAHTHSPGGGQGMNLGLCDAILLGPTIKKHMETLDDSVLRKYAKERKARALEIIHMSEARTNVMVDRKTWKGWLYSWAMWTGGRIPFITRGIATTLSGIRH